MPDFDTHPITKVCDTTEYPIYPPRGGLITLDVETPELFFQIMVTVSGNLIVEGKDGFVRYYPSLQAGAIYPITGVKILASANIDAVPYTTTATGIWWYGGM